MIACDQNVGFSHLPLTNTNGIYVKMSLPTKSHIFGNIIKLLTLHLCRCSPGLLRSVILQRQKKETFGPFADFLEMCLGNRASSILWPNWHSYFILFFCEKELGMQGHECLAADMKYHISISLHHCYGQLCIKTTLVNTEQ